MQPFVNQIVECPSRMGEIRVPVVEDQANDRSVQRS